MNKLNDHGIASDYWLVSFTFKDKTVFQSKYIKE